MIESVSFFINKIINSYTVKDWRLTLIKNWTAILGPMAQHAVLEKIEKEVITIGVFNSCWMQELYLLSPLLLEKINRTLDTPTIKHIRFKKISPLKTSTQHIKTKKEKYINIPKKTLTAPAQNALAKINDHELQSLLQKLYMLVEK